jgi:hypothetical protein
LNDASQNASLQGRQPITLKGTVRRALTLVALADAAPVFDGAD